jgi:hypothetical protein
MALDVVCACLPTKSAQGNLDNNSKLPNIASVMWTVQGNVVKTNHLPYPDHSPLAINSLAVDVVVLSAPSFLGSSWQRVCLLGTWESLWHCG